MMRKAGRRWWQARPKRSGLNLLGNTLAVIGVIASLGLIAVSASLSFRMGYRAADAPTDAWIYGVGTGLGDILKALAPFMAAWAVRKRDWLAVSCATGIFIVFSTYSFIAALGFAAEHRAHNLADRTDGIERREAVRQEMTRVNAKLQALGTPRSPATIQQAIGNELAKRVGPGIRSVHDISQGCTVQRRATYGSCKHIGVLKEELAGAVDYETQQRRAGELRSQLETMPSATATSTADPQLRVVGRLTSGFGLKQDDVAFALALLMAIFIELGSGLGLFISTTPWRHPEAPTPEAEDDPLDAFALAALQPAENAEIHLTELYALYRSWAAQTGHQALTRKAFRAAFNALAGEAGIRNRLRRGQEIYQDVRLLPMVVRSAEPRPQQRTQQETWR